MEPMYRGTKIEEMPDLTGERGKAWRMRNILPDTGLVAGWFLNCPNVHPAWDHWLVSLIHLRPIPGKPETEPWLLYPEATHQLTVMSLDPGYPLPGLNHNTDPLRYLVPIDAEKQFHVASDDNAIVLLYILVGWAVEGRLPPDSDYRRLWEESINNVSADIRANAHEIYHELCSLCLSEPTDG